MAIGVEGRPEFARHGRRLHARRRDELDRRWPGAGEGVGVATGVVSGITPGGTASGRSAPARTSAR